MKSNICRLLLVASLFLGGCKQTITNQESYTIGPIVFMADKKWQMLDGKGIDSDVKQLILDQKDTLPIELGSHVFSLKEDVRNIMSFKDKQEFEALSGKKMEVNNLIISENAEEEVRYGLFLKNYYTYDTINDIPVKIVQPKKVGVGITGVYISDVKYGNSFVIYGINLDSTSQKETLEIIRSIKYKQ